MKDQTVEHDTVLTLHPDQHPEIACRFQLEQCLGQGGTARVYHALRLETDGSVGRNAETFHRSGSAGRWNDCGRSASIFTG